MRRTLLGAVAIGTLMVGLGWEAASCRKDGRQEGDRGPVRQYRQGRLRQLPHDLPPEAQLGERSATGMDFGIAGKSALVCAASKGLGKGCALNLAREGVVLTI